LDPDKLLTLGIGYAIPLARRATGEDDVGAEARLSDVSKYPALLVFYHTILGIQGGYCGDAQPAAGTVGHQCGA
jgi:hypothetical protein